MSTVICSNFARDGYCRFGNNCKYLHQRPAQAQRSNGFSGANSTPLGSRTAPLKYQFNADTIRTDLSSDLPPWTISSYGVGKGEPNLFFGYDESQEELRWKSVQAQLSGNPQAYVQEEASLANQARSTISSALSNISTTVQLAEKLHDARFPNGQKEGTPRPPDFDEAKVLAGVQGGSSGSTTSNTSSGGFGAKPTPSGTAFGQSSFGQSSRPSAFGNNAPGTGVFGAPTGPRSQSAFGSSAFGQTSRPSAFGSSSTPTAPAAFGNSSPGTSAFSTTAASGSSAFGASAFGAKPAQSAFGISSTTAFGSSPASTPSAPSFGSTSTSPSAFGNSAFGQSAPSTSAFGPAPSAFSASPAGSGFGQSAFGQPSQPGGFGAFGRPPQPSNPSSASTGFGAFGQATAPSITSAFGQAPPTRPSAFSSTPSASSTTSANPFAAATAPVSAFNNFPVTNPFAPKPATPNFPPGVNVPAGWSYNDPWSYLLPVVGATEGKAEIDRASQAAFEASTFNLADIPLLPPPLSLRG